MGDAMRIISGEARGRTLFSPPGNETRPTSDKIRGSLFNILSGRVLDSQVLDLFGGTGALALEALSRGAAHAVIVEHSRMAVEVIHRNALSVLKDELSERVLIVKADYRSAISGMAGRQFDLVFLDPPYRMLDAYGDAISRLDAVGALSPEVIIVCEHRRGDTVVLPEEFHAYDVRQYGDTVVEFVRRR